MGSLVKRHLITGGAGFLGSHLVDKIILKGDEVICVDNFHTGSKNNIKKWIKHPKFDLITHNSDIGIDKRHFPYSKKIKNWYGQNNHIGDNAITLPIGIARKKYDHGDTKLLSKLSENSFKDILVYKNFSIDTNTEERSKVDEITTKNGIKMSPCKSQEDYLNFISRSVFCISPPGNGIDCHRIWECLYLKCIPIVKYHHAFEQFKDLPILFINDWNDVTTKFLKTKLIFEVQKKLKT